MGSDAFIIHFSVTITKNPKLGTYKQKRSTWLTGWGGCSPNSMTLGLMSVLVAASPHGRWHHSDRSHMREKSHVRTVWQVPVCGLFLKHHHLSLLSHWGSKSSTRTSGEALTPWRALTEQRSLRGREEREGRTPGHSGTAWFLKDD